MDDNMGFRTGRHIARWIEAEVGGRIDEADLRCLRAFAFLPHAGPPPGFAGRVLLAAGIRPTVREAAMLTAWWMRGLVAATLAGAGLVVLSVPVASLLLGLPSLIGSSVAITTQAILAAGGWLRIASQAAAVAVHLGEAARMTVRTPLAISLLAVSLSVGVCALYALSRLILPREEFLRC